MSLFYRGKHRRPPRFRWGRISGIVLLIAAVGTSLTLTLTNRPSEEPRIKASPTPVPTASPLPPRPDVYYIILDTYGGATALRETFGFDNTPFMHGLERQGFYVAWNSTTNYPRSLPSLSSSLNMKYLAGVAAKYGRNSDNLDPLYHMLDDYSVGERFRDLGYRWIHMGSWWRNTRTSSAADENIVYEDDSQLPKRLFGERVVPPPGPSNYRTVAYERILFQFDQIAKIAKRRGPTFTFAHILSPHGPNCFDRDGGYRNGAEAKALTHSQIYLDQMIYTSSLVTKLVTRLLDVPAEKRPLIIIQGDEGPYEGNPSAWDGFDLEDATRKFPILNAYYLPGLPSGPYPTITPVNTFRMVFDLYFGARLPLLPDRNFVFRDTAHLYDLTEVTEEVRELVLPPPTSGAASSG